MQSIKQQLLVGGHQEDRRAGNHKDSSQAPENERAMQRSQLLPKTIQEVTNSTCSCITGTPATSRRSSPTDQQNSDTPISYLRQAALRRG
jgi:hypothetical protein